MKLNRRMFLRGAAGFTLAIPFLPSPGASMEASIDHGKGTLSRVAGYRAGRVEPTADAIRVPVALGWIGEVDLATGRIVRLPFTIDSEGLSLGAPR